jgi:hypothetical protein
VKLMNVNADRLAGPLASLSLAVVLSWLAVGIGRADVPTPEQECRLRNAAICELNGVQFMVDGACPPPARTIRPPGSEQCGEAGRTDTRSGQPSPARMPAAQAAAAYTVVAPAPTSPGAAASPAPLRDLAWVGRAERWLLPLLLAVGGLLLVGLCVLILRLVRGWRATRKDRSTGEVGSELARPLLQGVVAAFCALPLGYQAAALAFDRVFSRANNHDTALPWLLAAPLAVLVFLLVSGLSFALIAWLLGCLFKGAGKGSR